MVVHFGGLQEVEGSNPQRGLVLWFVSVRSTVTIPYEPRRFKIRDPYEEQSESVASPYEQRIANKG